MILNKYSKAVNAQFFLPSASNGACMDVAAKLHMAFLDHLNVYVNRTASRINSMFICIKKSGRGSKYILWEGL
jgi:hypothetical protein